MQQMALPPESGLDWIKLGGLIVSAIGVGFGIFRWYVSRGRDNNLPKE